MERGRILVVDDDLNLCELVSLYLTREGFSVECVHDGEEAVTTALRSPPDLIVLDLMLPGKDGLEVCQEIRKHHDTPLIMLTAKSDDVDRILGLEMGADDYIPKPFNPRELTARVKAVLRRAKSTDPANGERNSLHFPGLEIDRAGRVVKIGDKEVSLTPKEFDLLWCLAIREERTFTRPELLEYVWGFDYFGDDRTVDVHIKRLRRKIEPDDHPYRYIQTVWGVGYKFKVVKV